jgi:hypothetical protein
MTEVRSARGPAMSWPTGSFCSLRKAAMLFSRRTGERMARSAQKRHPHLRTYGRITLLNTAQSSRLGRPSALPLSRAIGILAEALKGGPLISVIMPVHNPDPELLARNHPFGAKSALRKLGAVHCRGRITQSQGQGGACAGGGESEPRIKVEFRRENGHISRASNSALSLASGRFAALLDDDDLLDRDALLLARRSDRQQAGRQNHLLR